MRKRVDKLAALRKDKWVVPPAVKWVAWVALAAPWAVHLKAKWVAWVPLVPVWVAHPVGKWAA